ncbi:hypothetical protein AVEN_128316-1 [Araneus ventricosus]|uniref:Uncharacterized protein n=1 Tax=Araneus ventricosus TaxID=182803 RepID=A0A4Y2JLZ9_ARAVE|nr:hypothetical protein AVEN_128316-1 [Araneus ventricosus]
MYADVALWLRHLPLKTRLLIGSRARIPDKSLKFRHIPHRMKMNIFEDIRDALLHAVEKRSPPPRTPMDLLTALQDTFRHQSSPCHVVLLHFCVLVGPDTILRRCTSFSGSSVYVRADDSFA